MKILTVIQNMAALVFAVSMVITSAWAHGSTKPQHGGIVEMDGETLFELVVLENKIELYVSYDDEEVDGAGYTANLTIKSEDETKKVNLTPVGGNKFETTGVLIAKGSKVIVFVKDRTTMATAGTKFIIE